MKRKSRIFEKTSTIAIKSGRGGGGGDGISLLLLLLLLSSLTLSSLAQQLPELTLNETEIIDKIIYEDGTILIRVTDTTAVTPNTTCSNNKSNHQELNFKIIKTDGSILSFDLSNNTIPESNYCQIDGSDFTRKPIINNTNTNYIIDGESNDSNNKDAIRIFPISNSYVLVTYFCKVPNSLEICGLIIDWNGKILSEVSFDQNPDCTDSEIVLNINPDTEEFLRACFIFNDQEKTIEWTKYSFLSGSIKQLTTGKISNVYSYTTNITKLFATEDGGYALITSQNAAADIWKIFVSFIPSSLSSDDKIEKGPFQLDSRGTYKIHSCAISYASLGYNCIIYNNISIVKIDFRSTGTFNSTFNFNISSSNLTIWQVIPLYYGGSMVIVNNSNEIDGWVFDDEGNWNMTLKFNNHTIKGLVGIFPNNSIWGFNYDDVTTITSLETDQTLSNFSTVQNFIYGSSTDYGNAYIKSTYPTKNLDIKPSGRESEFNITIDYSIPISLSTGNISIWQKNGGIVNNNNKDVLRQTISGLNSEFIKLSNDNKTVQVTILSSTFNQPDTSYYVLIDNGFVTDETGEILLGVKKNVWIVNTISSVEVEEYTNSDSKSTIMRFIPLGSKYYTSLNKSQKKEFINQFVLQLSSIIPCSPDRIYTHTKYQYDIEVPLKDRILFRVYIREISFSNGNYYKSNNGSTIKDTSALWIIDNLNMLIKNKTITGISQNNHTLWLDESYGTIRAPGLWERYRFILLGFLGGMIILITIYIIATRRSKDQHSKIQNIVIFVLVFISVDFGLDVTFIVARGKELEWLLPVSLTFFIIPIVINTIVSFFIITSEQTSNFQFLKWWTRYSNTGLIFFILSWVDIDFLNIMSSNFAGIRRFNAPLSFASTRFLLFIDLMLLLIEDVGQAIILIIYQKKTVLPHIVPILVLSSCLFVILIKLIYITSSFNRNKKTALKVGKAYEPDNNIGDDDGLQSIPPISPAPSVTSVHSKHPLKQKDESEDDGGESINDGKDSVGGEESYGEDEYDEEEGQKHLNVDIFETSSRESSPDTDAVIMGTDEEGNPIIKLRGPKEYKGPLLQNVPQVKLVKHAIVGDDKSEVDYGEIVDIGAGVRLSGTGIIGNTEDLLEREEIITFGDDDGDNDNGDDNGGVGASGDVSTREISQPPTIVIHSSSPTSDNNGNKGDDGDN
ncbi:hypothetical protein Glove_137g124 [Diversispora epigaea]|uniref:TRP C-terminal domain-containing protein n=1 Tax=Diversispora epigaea TaxID=1348612 RepID=A0A397J5I9_9GLOM|nr:hypothetical protein Glove_137g124 [Diversispora epigaea]